jgi:putative transposase
MNPLGQRELLTIIPVKKSGGLVRSGDGRDTTKVFDYMRSQAAQYSLVMMSRALEVSRSGFYAWVARRPSARAIEDAAVAARIQCVHQQSRGTYGAPRVHAELAAEGRHIGRKRVARLMREKGLRGVSRRKWTTTTKRDWAAAVAPDLIKRDFRAQGPDQLWVADITYVPTWAGFLYLAVVLDAWSRPVVGWAFAGHLRVQLVLAALEMAVRRRQPRSVIHHSDHGSQYTSVAFGVRCREAGVRPSMGSVGDAYDNALCESFFATLECELLDRMHLRTRQEAEREVFEFIEGFYNSGRRHSSLGYDCPIAFEERHLGVARVTSPDLSTETG